MMIIDDLSFSYKNKGVFEALNLELKEGGIYGLLGLNGSGKSTLLYLMSGLLRAQSGSVRFKGEDVSKRLPSVLQDMYIVPEEFELPDITLRKYVEINRIFYPNFSEDVLMRSLKSFDMDIDMRLGASSMGQRKKAIMSFALATNTSLLLMDEPTNGLDVPSKSQFRKAVAEGMNDNRIIIISTHQLRDIENMLDHLIIIDESTILLNESILNISSKLRFETSRVSEANSNAIFSYQIGLDMLQVTLNDNPESETPVNLELLFNATLAERKKFAEIFNRNNR